jgi:hypothetical protein
LSLSNPSKDELVEGPTSRFRRMLPFAPKDRWQASSDGTNALLPDSIWCLRRPTEEITSI